MKYTQAQAVEALRARTNGEWDNKELIKLGALSPNAMDDCARIIGYTERAAEVHFYRGEAQSSREEE